MKLGPVRFPVTVSLVQHTALKLNMLIWLSSVCCTAAHRHYCVIARCYLGCMQLAAESIAACGGQRPGSHFASDRADVGIYSRRWQFKGFRGTSPATKGPTNKLYVMYISLYDHIYSDLFCILPYVYIYIQYIHIIDIFHQ